MPGEQAFQGDHIFTQHDGRRLLVGARLKAVGLAPQWHYIIKAYKLRYILRQWVPAVQVDMLGDIFQFPNQYLVLLHPYLEGYSYLL